MTTMTTDIFVRFALDLSSLKALGFDGMDKSQDGSVDGSRPQFHSHQAGRRMTQDGRAITKVDHLLARRQQYDARTPDEDQAMSARSSHDNVNSLQEDPRESKSDRKSVDSNRSGDSSSSDDEDGLLPSFGAKDALVGTHGYAPPPAQAASASAVSLGLDTQNVNGFVSRDDLSRENGHGYSDKASRKVKTGKGKGKKLTWQERERQRTRAFAREMAFVVGIQTVLQSSYARFNRLHRSLANRPYRAFCWLWWALCSLEKSWPDSKCVPSLKRLDGAIWLTFGLFCLPLSIDMAGIPSR